MLITQGIKVCGASAEVGEALALVERTVGAEVAMGPTSPPGKTVVVHLMEIAVVADLANAVATEETVVEADLANAVATEGIGVGATEGIVQATEGTVEAMEETVVEAKEGIVPATEDERVRPGISILHVVFLKRALHNVLKSSSLHCTIVICMLGWLSRDYRVCIYGLGRAPGIDITLHFLHIGIAIQ